MPRNEHLVICGELGRPHGPRKDVLNLGLHGFNANVNLRISDISRRLVANIPDPLVDLLEIASFVYAADSAIYRGGKSEAHLGRHWRRNFRFMIPVRCTELWSDARISELLAEVLGFLSEDSFAFEFVPMAECQKVEQYFEFADGEGATGFTPDDVILFSGGLDSLAGAVETLAMEGRKVVLVSHRSATKILDAQKHLVQSLAERVGAHRLLHVPVLTNLTSGTLREHTHRTRSFLFAAIAAVVARLFQRSRVHFFENGIISLNLPIAEQVVGARATRSTHPKSLEGFSRLFSALFAEDFSVDNPFFWRTKKDIVSCIAEHGHGDLIRHSRSCARVYTMTRLHPHCGECSQCIDRRFAVLAAGLADEDPAEAYKVDLLTGDRPAGPDREGALAYVRTASELQGMDEVSFFSRFGEVSRAVSAFPGRFDETAEKIHRLHLRHAEGVCSAFDEAIRQHAAELRSGALSPACLLRLHLGDSGAEPHRAEPVVSAEAIACPRRLRLRIDDGERCVKLDDLGVLKGADYELIAALAEPFREATRETLLHQDFLLISARKLADILGLESEASLRKRILRCRHTVEGLIDAADDQSLAGLEMIENIPWHGYRLNPDVVELVDHTALRP